MIAAKLLGRCRRCRTPLTYNIFDHPYCDRCDCIEIASVCYHCGAAAFPVYEQETVTLDGFPHEMWFWNCPACGGCRVDLEHLEMGSDTSRRLMARLGRAVRYVRFVVPLYARRLLRADLPVRRR
jgi:hypothetical protein